MASDVMMQELPDGEAIFLHLGAEEYFGLDVVGTRMFQALVGAGSVEAALAELEQEFDVDPGELRDDVGELVDKLLGQGLIEIRDP